MNISSSTLRTLLALLLSFVVLGAVACGDDGTTEECKDSAGEVCDPENDEDCTCEVVETTECSPDTDANCECTDDTGASCEEGAEDCSCAVVTPETCSAGSDEICICEDANNASCEEGSEGCTCTPQTAYRFILLEDLTQGASGDYPGVDLDAVTVTLADGSTLAATSVEDFEVGDQGNAQDPTAALGLPDSDCEVKNFVALGGQDVGGFIVLGFADEANDGIFTKGSAIVAHELGKSMCPDSDYDDDPYSLSISVSKDREAFVEIATEALGNNPITIP